MIRKIGYDETIVKTVTCKDCGAIMQYAPRDVIHRSSDNSTYINCEDCRRDLDVDVKPSVPSSPPKWASIDEALIAKGLPSRKVLGAHTNDRLKWMLEHPDSTNEYIAVNGTAHLAEFVNGRLYPHPARNAER